MAIKVILRNLAHSQFTAVAYSKVRDAEHDGTRRHGHHPSHGRTDRAHE